MWHALAVSLASRCFLAAPVHTYRPSLTNSLAASNAPLTMAVVLSGIHFGLGWMGGGLRCPVDAIHTNAPTQKSKSSHTIYPSKL